MDPKAVFYPMIALALVTFSVLLLIPFVRFRAVLRRRATPEDFELGESEKVPDGVRLPNRNYMNLLELPVLFYVVCLAFFVTAQVDGVLLMLCWVYVGLRVIHSAIHLTYNQVLHRLAAFAASNLVLLTLWLRLLFALRSQ